MKLAIYSFCAGALAMYFWDPVSGRQRRALFRDQLVHMRHEIEDTAEDLAKDVRNRAQGVIDYCVIEDRIVGKAPSFKSVLDFAPMRSKLGDLAGSELRVDADDVRVLCRDLQHLRTARADEDRRVRLLHRLGQTVQAVDRVVLALEAVRAGRPQSLVDVERFDHPSDAHAVAFLRDAGLLVVRVHPSGSDAELDPSSREHVDRRHLLGEHDRMLVVVVEDQRADLQIGGRIGRGHHRRDRRELVAEVVGEEQ